MAQTNARTSILEATIELLAMHGYGGMSLRMVSEQVGIRKSSIFHHFSSKDALVLEVYTRVIERFLETLEPLDTALEGGPIALEQLDAVIDRMAALCSEHRASARLGMQLFVFPAQPKRGVKPTDTNAPIVQLFLRFGHWLTLAQEAGLVRPMSVRHALIHIVGSILFYPAIAHEVGTAIVQDDPWSESSLSAWTAELRTFIRNAIST